MRLKKGTKVRVKSNFTEHQFEIGNNVIVIDYFNSDADGDHYLCTDGLEDWSLCETEFEVITDEVKPKIDLEYWRYKFAGMAMQGMFASSGYIPDQNIIDFVHKADLLIAELQKEKK